MTNLPGEDSPAGEDPAKAGAGWPSLRNQRILSVSLRPSPKNAGLPAPKFLTAPSDDDPALLYVMDPLFVSGAGVSAR